MGGKEGMKGSRMRIASSFLVIYFPPFLTFLTLRNIREEVNK
jgi:hypothetical protein